MKVIHSIKEVLAELYEVTHNHPYDWERRKQHAQAIIQRWIEHYKQFLPFFGMVTIRGSPPFYGLIEELSLDYHEELEIKMRWARDGTEKKFRFNFNGGGDEITIILAQKAKDAGVTIIELPEFVPKEGRGELKNGKK